MAKVLKAQPSTPAAQANASKPNETETLPSGATAEYLPFKGKHVFKAQRLADGDQSKVLAAMAATATLLDGKAFVIEDLDEMDGRDVLQLIAHYNGLF